MMGFGLSDDAEHVRTETQGRKGRYDPKAKCYLT